MGGERIEIGRAEAASLLGWWLESGVDAVTQEQPRNWLQRESDAAVPAATPAPVKPQEQLPDTLDRFRDWLKASASVPLGGAGRKPVLPVGFENAPIMLLADAPTAEEAAADRPIAGQAWALTERMLAAIGMKAEDAYCANISCFHAPGLRIGEQELEACATIARRHIALARPQRLLLLGDAPGRALIGKPLAAARGHVHKVEGIRTVATFHPRLLLNQTSYKSEAWKDLLLLMEDSR